MNGRWSLCVVIFLVTVLLLQLTGASMPDAANGANSKCIVRTPVIRAEINLGIL